MDEFFFDFPKLKLLFKIYPVLKRFFNSLRNPEVLKIPPKKSNKLKLSFINSLELRITSKTFSKAKNFF